MPPRSTRHTGVHFPPSATAGGPNAIAREQSVDLDFRADLKHGPVTGNVSFYPKREQRLDLVLRPENPRHKIGAAAAKLHTSFGNTVGIGIK